MGRVQCPVHNPPPAPLSAPPRQAWPPRWPARPPPQGRLQRWPLRLQPQGRRCRCPVVCQTCLGAVPRGCQPSLGRSRPSACRSWPGEGRQEGWWEVGGREGWGGGGAQAPMGRPLAFSLACARPLLLPCSTSQPYCKGHRDPNPSWQPTESSGGAAISPRRICGRVQGPGASGWRCRGSAVRRAGQAHMRPGCLTCSAAGSSGPHLMTPDQDQPTCSILTPEP